MSEKFQLTFQLLLECRLLSLVATSKFPSIIYLYRLVILILSPFSCERRKYDRILDFTWTVCVNCILQILCCVQNILANLYLSLVLMQLCYFCCSWVAGTQGLLVFVLIYPSPCIPLTALFIHAYMLYVYHASVNWLKHIPELSGQYLSLIPLLYYSSHVDTFSVELI